MTEITEAVERLKPCPFCGTPASLRRTGVESWVHCTGCHSSSAMASNEIAAIRAWNTRHAAREQPPQEGAGEPAKGWLYHCPDTGTEWSDNHPIESGEVPDAKDVRPATLDALHAELMAAWEVLAERPSPPNPQARIEALEKIDALRADEGDSITLLCDNPDGPPNNAVECCGAWTGWQDRRFEGETLEAAIQAAFDARAALSPVQAVKGDDQASPPPPVTP